MGRRGGGLKHRINTYTPVKRKVTVSFVAAVILGGMNWNIPPGAVAVDPTSIVLGCFSDELIRRKGWGAYVNSLGDSQQRSRNGRGNGEETHFERGCKFGYSDKGGGTWKSTRTVILYQRSRGSV